jgi:hypothetical protein
MPKAIRNAFGTVYALVGGRKPGRGSDDRYREREQDERNDTPRAPAYKNCLILDQESDRSKQSPCPPGNRRSERRARMTRGSGVNLSGPKASLSITGPYLCQNFPGVLAGECAGITGGNGLRTPIAATAR